MPTICDQLAVVVADPTRVNPTFTPQQAGEYFCSHYPGCSGCELYLTPAQTTGGAGSPPAPAAIPGAASSRPSCGSCRKPAASSAAPVTSGTVAAPAVAKGRRGYPWWVYVLAMMVLAGVLEHD